MLTLEERSLLTDAPTLIFIVATDMIKCYVWAAMSRHSPLIKEGGEVDAIQTP